MVSKILSKRFVFILTLLICINQINGQKKFNLSTEREVTILGVNSAIVLTSFLINQNLKITHEEISLLDKNRINSFDRSATNYYSKNLSLISDVLLISSVSLPISFLFMDNQNNNLVSIGIMYLETMSLTYGLTNLTKNLTQRFRPYAYNPEVPLSEKLDIDTKKSFFSGHTSTAFASAVFFSTVYSELSTDEKSEKLIWAGSLTLATAVGLLRYFSGKHFPTDIFTAAIVGSAIGYGIPKLHKNKSDLMISTSSNSNLISVKYYFR